MILRYDTIASEMNNTKLVRQTFPGSNTIMFSLIMKERFDSKYEVYWDGESFIFNNFYDFLNRYINRCLIKEDDEEYTDIKFLLNEEWALETKEILDEAIKLKWYNK